MSTELLPCPNPFMSGLNYELKPCDGDVMISVGGGQFRANCHKCGVSGPWRDTSELAADAWNSSILKQKGQPAAAPDGVLLPRGLVDDAIMLIAEFDSNLGQECDHCRFVFNGREHEDTCRVRNTMLGLMELPGVTLPSEQRMALYVPKEKL